MWSQAQVTHTIKKPCRLAADSGSNFHHMKPQSINYAKVAAAVEKYAPKAISKKNSYSHKPPADSALRKTLKGPTRKCTGFTHPDFLNNELQ
jgi:hypothetical protein